LIGNSALAEEILTAAIAFDPLNYTAHATTLKQFEMILKKRGESSTWLSPHKPPKPMHYAGYINLEPSITDQKALKQSVIDQIQKNDIGFGFGALAAGSDIIIAEALLSEGGDLHVILPCEKDIFLEHSVIPFGSDWASRFEACIEQASAVKIAVTGAPWPHNQINRLTGQYAMGQAVLHSYYFNVEACQLLIWDKKHKASFTGVHAIDWEQTRKNQIIISPNSSRPHTKPTEDKKPIYSYVLKRSDEAQTQIFSHVTEAFEAGQNLLLSHPNICIALHVATNADNSALALDKILEIGMPKSIFMSELFASILVYQDDKNLNISFAGLVEIDPKSHLTCYAFNA
jgi:hypothetical protein